MQSPPTIEALSIRIAALEQRMLDAGQRNDDRFTAQAQAVKTAMDASEKAIGAAMIASEKAVLKAENASEKRFEAVNEFRALVNDIVGRLLPRAEADARFISLSEKLEDTVERQNRISGGDEGQKQSWDAMKSILAAAVAVLAVWAFFSNKGAPAPAQVVYVPSAPGMPPVVTSPSGAAGSVVK